MTVESTQSVKPKELPGGLYGPEWFEFEWTPDDLPVRVRGRADFSRDRYAVTSMTVEGESVTGELLRSVPVQEILRDAVYDVPDMILNYRKAKELLDSDKLAAVALVYRMALAASDPPKQAVAKRLDMPVSTAGRWIMKARQQGYLGATEERRAGA